ncbi:MAG: TRAP transporter large permease subunit [Aquamicrobium sp.]|uniref:TRAP transporter large permease n=1 Tax=Aquamicrobium sp. TaxID=1872579 RepID=UPI00349E859A|nr:TRAP transporter large permease subunit [Aquamicrobium sp.]
MTSTAILLLLVIFALLGSSLWIGIALVGVGYFALEFMTSRNPTNLISTVMWSSTTTWTLTALPLFIWMGEILFRSNISKKLFEGLSPWLHRVPGRLLHTNVVGCTIFAAMAGSSAATCATVGRITIPELKARKYPERMIIGTLAGAGTLGLLIPPSIMMIVYGVAANVSIGQLFLAGILPGLVLAALFSGYIMLWSVFNADKLPPRDPPMPLMQRVRATLGILPACVLILMVLGSIYSGVVTPTESAALGVVGALVISAAEGTLTRRTFIEGVIGATRLSAMIGLILLGAAFLTLAMAYTGIPREMAHFVDGLGLSRPMLLIALGLIYIVLGCFLDGVSLVLLTISVVIPTLETAGIDLLWFGIFVIILVEMAQITPPVGFNLFVLQAVTGKDLALVARYAAPQFAILVLLTVIVSVFPQIVTAIPDMLRGP